MTEEWRIVPSDPSLLASSAGRIMVARYSVLNGSRRRYGATPTSGQWDGKRYIYVRRGHRTRKVARLVCEAFHGVPPFAGAVAMHSDENARNNCQTNLSWGTQKENLNAPGFIDRCRARTGAKAANPTGRNQYTT